MKTKGARLTTEISLPGRFVVFVPHGDGLGVSRRLDDDERNRLKAIVKGIAPKTGGVIVRTAAEGASAEDVARDLDFLMRLWSTIEASAKKAKSPALIYQEAELPLRVTRDLFTGDFERLLVDHDRTHKRIVGYLKKTSPHMVERVTRYKEREPLLEAFGVEQEIKSTLSRRVDLPSGGYLIFDYAEAFTVIDVNTGRFVGSRSKRNGPGRLEDTITKNNLEAVKEVVRQLRLRDVGGIIVIDFIDMANPKNRQQVEDALRQELERDRTKTYVVEISPLGLVEMTRQNVTDGPREVMTRKCPTCDGDGIIVSESTAAVEVERRIRGLVTPGSRAKAFKVELNAKVAELLVGLDGSRIQELEEVTKRRFFFVGVENVHLDHMRVIDQGTVEKLAPSAPVEPGQELELKLGEVGLHDPRAGAGKVKGFEVVVAGAAKLVGKRVRVRITAVLEDVAYAVLTTVQEGATVPITAEAEAEKPTRAKRPSKAAADADAEVDEDAGVDVDAEADIEAEAEAEAEELDEDAIPTPRAPRKPAASRSAASRSRRKPLRPTATMRRPEPPTSHPRPSGPGHASPQWLLRPRPPRRRRPSTRAPSPTRRASTARRRLPPRSAPGEARAAAGTASGSPPPRRTGTARRSLSADDPEETAEAGSEEPTAPVIHLPERDLGRNGDGADGQDDASRGRGRRAEASDPPRVTRGPQPAQARGRCRRNRGSRRGCNGGRCDRRARGRVDVHANERVGPVLAATLSKPGRQRARIFTPWITQSSSSVTSSIAFATARRWSSTACRRAPARYSSRSCCSAMRR